MRVFGERDQISVGTAELAANWRCTVGTDDIEGRGASDIGRVTVLVLKMRHHLHRESSPDNGPPRQ